MVDTIIKVTYTPSLKATVDKRYLYKDGKAHIRLRDFGQSVETISGFEDKLTFLVSYCFFNYITESAGGQDLVKLFSNKFNKEDFITLRDNFMKTKDYDILNMLVKMSIANTEEYTEEDNALRITPVYSQKVKGFKYFGSIYTPELNSSDSINSSSLAYLASLFKTVESGANMEQRMIDSLLDFITNDSYELILCKKPKKNKLDKLYSKYNKIKSGAIKNIKLW